MVRDKKSWARAELTSVLEPSPDRVEPPCRHFAECGGCQWQFAAYEAQLDWKQSIVAGQLRHLGGIADPPVRADRPDRRPLRLPQSDGFRRLRGQAALRAPQSDTVAISSAC